MTPPHPGTALGGGGIICNFSVSVTVFSGACGGITSLAIYFSHPKTKATGQGVTIHCQTAVQTKYRTYITPTPKVDVFRRARAVQPLGAGAAQNLIPPEQLPFGAAALTSRPIRAPKGPKTLFWDVVGTYCRQRTRAKFR